MGKYRVFSPSDTGVKELEKENRLLARKVAEEGIVLLYNNGILPLADKKIALFGTGARMTVFGGTGSGDTKGREKVTIEEGLRNAGYVIDSTLWLDEFDQTYVNAHKQWKDEVEESIKGYHLWNVVDMFREIDKHHFFFPVGNMIEERHMNGNAKTAVYVIARQAGEGGDRKVIPGDYLLSEFETESIRTLKEHYDKLIVMINSGGSVDCSFMDVEGQRPDALLYIGQLGEEAGNAVAAVLAGTCVPSGKLTATWAKKYEDFPYANEYAYMAKDAKKIDYKEDIFVGYRWFDQKKESVRFPFGYGLSYTKFENTIVSLEQKGTRINVSIKSCNTGNQYAGKEVIQLYVKKPADRLEQASRELVGFAKTNLLEPGEEVLTTVELNLYDFVSYDKENQESKLVAGEYEIHLGQAEGSIKYVASLIMNRDVIIKKVRKLSQCPEIFRMKTNEILHNVTPNEFTKNEIELVVDDSGFQTEVIDYKKELKGKNDDACRIAQKLTDEEICTLLVGGPVVSYGYNRAPGTVGRTTNELYKKYHIPNINMADGPAGLNLIPQSLITKGGTEKSYEHLPEAWSFGFLPKLEKIAVGNPKKDRMVCQFTTAFPSTAVRTQTWNKKLIHKVGEAVGKEMRAFGITLWLAPAINIQRNPLCGRNFEYASEDPVLSGYMAASIINGVQSVGGVGATIKHFCGNNQETEREYMSSNIGERALREIYLKGFEIAIRESNPWAVMSSYNKLNGTYTANNKELLTDVLRHEWGYQGLVMTDWGAITTEKGEFYQCANSGNDLIMPGESKIMKQLLKDLKENRLKREAAVYSASNILAVMLESAVAK